MSDTNLPVVRLKWYSVAIRYFAPMVGNECFIATLTIRAVDGKDALLRGQALFQQIFFDPESEQYFLPGGIPMEPWCFHAIALPDERAAPLDAEFAADAKDTPREGASGEEGAENVVYLFPKRKRPPDGGQGGGGDTPPSGDPSGGNKQ
ncbi:MAG: hypothetical protein A2762_00075 [Candidatus Lloydbacteria bacterium RIFCSPHIGHO2_01_FULL_54_11]|nr:MAG: hypothetical protein A2762_00075 [Candidatus Lloydbacteria bacterium RIFCSPHIGHO2_01_FULL_54_11]OGZ13205.1 MAG: hypothetical protein A2948_06030 [Candidatus Lloydbacteria bacterium RIFCSPLOWO2_01_FULL_54_18]OGZ17052.1 MAG: hypothetical protein A3H76_01050 [Candidatus Lloydbacteria bacterium RIFCSPLOWO2_02_FULL_54_12]